MNDDERNAPKKAQTGPCKQNEKATAIIARIIKDKTVGLNFTIFIPVPIFSQFHIKEGHDTVLEKHHAEITENLIFH